MIKYKMAIVPPNLIDVMWDQVAPILQRPIDKAHGEVTLQILKDSLLSGDGRLVTITNGAEVIAVNTLEVRTFPTGKKSLYIPLTGGDDLLGWMPDFLEFAKTIAKEYGCTELRGISVRKGWMRKLEPMGWEEISTTIACPVGD